MRLLIALALAGCSSAHVPTAPVAPPAVVAPDNELAPQLLISGNHALPTARLRADLAKVVCDARHQIDQVIATATKGAETPGCGTPEDYRISVEVFYMTEGFFEAKATVVTRHGAPTTIAVTEGPRYRFGSITSVDKGARDVDRIALDDVVTIHPDEPFARDRIRAVIDRVAERYDEAGFGLANITPLVDLHRDAHRVDITLEIERGPIAKIASLEVRGQRADRVATTARELAELQPGSVFSNRALHRAEQRLRTSGRFAEVGITVQGAAGSDQVTLTVHAD